MFISKPVAGRIYIAKRSSKGYCKLLWSIVPVSPTTGESRIEAAAVPRLIRRKAYRVLQSNREEQQ
jgi:hypothetical protein